MIFNKSVNQNDSLQSSIIISTLVFLHVGLNNNMMGDNQ